MSIHKSKGLEFPVVVVPDLERRGRASTTSVAFDPELGPLVCARQRRRIAARWFGFVQVH
jgi:ATP-dependent helicase/nuclease subunit A